MENKLNGFSHRKKWRFGRGSLAWPGRQTHNLEFEGAMRLEPEVAGSNPAPQAELASVWTNGTIRASATPSKFDCLPC